MTAEADSATATEEPEKPSPWYTAPWFIVNLAIVLIGVIGGQFCVSPGGPHCSEEQGNVTCVERHGGKRPYCNRADTMFDGCSAAPPSEEFAVSCGSLVGGLPGDPTCSKVVADSRPSEEESQAERWLSFDDSHRTIIVIVVSIGCMSPLLYNLVIGRVIDWVIDWARLGKPRADAGPRDYWRPVPKVPPPRVGNDVANEKDDHTS